jgi:hypothetical protein
MEELMFDVGDVVVCVDATPVPKGHVHPTVDRLACAAFLRVGKMYRVRACDGPTVRLVGDPIPSGRRGGYCSSRFRKVKPADPEFVELLRTIKIKSAEPA